MMDFWEGWGSGRWPITNEDELASAVFHPKIPLIFSTTCFRMRDVFGEESLSWKNSMKVLRLKPSGS
jgi:hypothetical protein